MCDTNVAEAAQTSGPARPKCALPALINPSFKSVIPQNQEESGCTCCSCSGHQTEIKLTSRCSWALLDSAEQDLSHYPGSLILRQLQFSNPDVTILQMLPRCIRLSCCVCILPSVNWDDFNERVLPDLGQVQSGTAKSPTSVLLLSQQTNRVTSKRKKKKWPLLIASFISLNFLYRIKSVKSLNCELNVKSQVLTHTTFIKLS